MLLEAMTAKNMPVENIINTFSKAAEEGDVAFVVCIAIWNWIMGLGNRGAMTKFEQSTDAIYQRWG